MREVGYITSGDGTPLYFESTGAGLPVSLLDGIGCAGYVWKYIAPHLARSARTVHFHYRGHGLSAPPADPTELSIARSADDLALVLDRLGIDKTIACGHSMGVQVALEFFHRRRDRTAGLILMCGSYGRPLDTFQGDGRIRGVLEPARSFVHGAGDTFRTLWRFAFPTRFAWWIARATEVDGAMVSRADFMPYLEHFGTLDPALFLDMLAAAQAHTAEAYLGEIDVPVLIIGGERDGFTPVWLSELMHERIAGSELVMLPKGTHTGVIEHRELVELALDRWLERHFGARFAVPPFTGGLPAVRARPSR